MSDPRVSAVVTCPSAGPEVTGIRTLIASLPVEKPYLKSITDMKLSMYGVTAQGVKDDGKSTQADGVAVYGLSGVSLIKYTNVLARSSSAVIDTTQGLPFKVVTPYSIARLVTLKVTCTPCASNEQNGRWGIAFLPFRTKDDDSTVRSQYAPMPLSKLERIHGCVSGPVLSPLHLSFDPQPVDGLIYSYNPLETTIGAIVLAYEQPNRETFHWFRSEDFSPGVTVEGKLQLQQPLLGPKNETLKDTIWTSNYPISVYDESVHMQFNFKETADFECQKSEKFEGTLNIKGHADAIWHA